LKPIICYGCSGDVSGTFERPMPGTTCCFCCGGWR